jgi:hypothetical protein
MCHSVTMKDSYSCCCWFFVGGLRLCDPAGVRQIRPIRPAFAQSVHLCTTGKPGKLVTVWLALPVINASVRIKRGEDVCTCMPLVMNTFLLRMVFFFSPPPRTDGLHLASSCRLESKNASSLS